MQISAINSLYFNPQRRKTSKVLSYKGLLKDIFQNSFENSFRKTKVKNLKGEDVEAEIIKTNPALAKTAHTINRFTIYIKGVENGHLTLDEVYNDSVYMSHLSTKRNSQRQYYGLGTELLKSAVEESKRKGKEGAISTCAHYSGEPPFAFYFKNNFKITDSDILDFDMQRLFNAPLQYIVNYGKNPFELLPKECDTFYMFLDKKGAQALLNNERLCDKRICDTVAYELIDDEMHSAQFIESPNENEYFLQVLNEDKKEEKLCLIMALEPRREEGKKYFKITGIFDDFESNSDMVNDFAHGMLNSLAEKYL